MKTFLTVLVLFSIARSAWASVDCNISKNEAIISTFNRVDLSPMILPSVDLKTYRNGKTENQTVRIGFFCNWDDSDQKPATLCTISISDLNILVTLNGFQFAKVMSVSTFPTGSNLPVSVTFGDKNAGEDVLKIECTLKP